jgi:hypothetical protein
MSQSQSKNFLIIGSEVLIAQDIEMTIRRLWPDAKVLFKTNLQDAESWLDSAEHLLYAFVGTHPEEIVESAIQRKVAARGGRTVMLGYDCTMKEAMGAFAFASALLFLPFPFTEEHLLQLFKIAPTAPE